mmetsp:Transcript_15256/g.45781  ORF Transcript_15256/g.45781 Transcript_15256/m.45781 type:complete len:627 (+) Transcript_15256:89-1969(+)
MATRFEELMSELMAEHERMHVENELLRNRLQSAGVPAPPEQLPAAANGDRASYDDDAANLEGIPPSLGVARKRARQITWDSERSRSLPAAQGPPRSVKVNFMEPMEPMEPRQASKASAFGPSSTSKSSPVNAEQRASAPRVRRIADRYKTELAESMKTGVDGEQDTLHEVMAQALKETPRESFKVKMRRSLLAIRDGEQGFQQKVRNIIASRKFDAYLGVVIIVNSICVGVEATLRLQRKDVAIFSMLEHLFLVIYIMEIAGRVYGFGLKCFNSGWVRFDFILIVLGVLGEWVFKPILDANKGMSKQAEGALNPVLLLRVFRLFRLARALRLLVQFRTLWMLVQGLIHSSSTILFTVGLIVMLLYIFSCISMEVLAIPFADEPGPFGDIVRNHWSSIPASMLTLVRYVNLDSISGMYEPMIKENNALLLFFMPFLLLVSIALMNLVTAVIVEGALDEARRHKLVASEFKKRKLQEFLPHLRRLFGQLDKDGDGYLSMEEVQKAPTPILDLLEDCLGVHSLEAMFAIIDEDASGEISVGEFCDGLTKLACSDSPIELFMILTQISHLRVFMERCFPEHVHVLHSQQSFRYPFEARGREDLDVDDFDRQPSAKGMDERIDKICKENLA